MICNTMVLVGLLGFPAPQDDPSPWTRRDAGRADAVRRGGGSQATESAVEAGLRWLARHQEEDGHWSARDFSSRCSSGKSCGEKENGMADFDVGITALSLLAFLGAGITPASEPSYEDPVTKKTVRPGDVAKKGLAWLIQQQTSEGRLSPDVAELMYNHAMATLALVEAYGMTGREDYKQPAQKAVDFILRAQNYGLAWRYKPRPGNNDTSVTGWCLQALHAASLAKLEVPKTSFEGAKGWLNRVTMSSGETGYDRLGSGEVYVPGKNEEWASHPTMTAIGVFGRLTCGGKKTDPLIEKGAKLLLSDLPVWDLKGKRPTIDSYYWYCATHALYRLDGPDGPSWKKWNQALVDVLCKHQRGSADGCADGSWDAYKVDRWAYGGGRVATTALDVLTLEVYYRYPP